MDGNRPDHCFFPMAKRSVREHSIGLKHWAFRGGSVPNVFALKAKARLNGEWHRTSLISGIGIDIVRNSLNRLGSLRGPALALIAHASFSGRFRPRCVQEALRGPLQPAENCRPGIRSRRCCG